MAPRLLTLLLVLAGCNEASSPSSLAGAFDVGVRASTTACSFEMFSPVVFSAAVAIGEEKRDTITHAEGRFPLGWRARAGFTDVTSGPNDSTTVPGGFTFVC